MAPITNYEQHAQRLVDPAISVQMVMEVRDSLLRLLPPQLPAHRRGGGPALPRLRGLHLWKLSRHRGPLLLQPQFLGPAGGLGGAEDRGRIRHGPTPGPAYVGTGQLNPSARSFKIVTESPPGGDVPVPAVHEAGAVQHPVAVAADGEGDSYTRAREGAAAPQDSVHRA